MATKKRGGPAAPVLPVWADGWLLDSIRIYGRKGATLRDVIAAGDYLNHAIFMPGELRGGLARLLEAGRIREKAGKWYARGKNRIPGASTRSAPLSDGEIDEAIRAYQAGTKPGKKRKR